VTAEAGAIVGVVSAVALATLAAVAADPGAVGDVATSAGGAAGVGGALFLLHQMLQRMDKIAETTAQAARRLDEIAAQRVELERARQDRADTAAAAGVYREAVRRAHAVAPLPDSRERDAVAAAAAQLDNRLGE